ncbi:hypothetical protein [Hoyosella altamirensis]|uniref:Uncharacterized protein n=1 Tax=Hoyosella altamirensis TaxID=616997 RepID=A0A839RLC7_9ACTN|nr:hypothetical protein [Hoyosella altamirensis]MBB3037187.1 hypothetical protein [Hoyosella altamirensis]
MARADNSGSRRKPVSRGVHTSTARDFRRSYRGRTVEEPLRRHGATRALAQILAAARSPLPPQLSVAQLSGVGILAGLIIAILAVALLFSAPFGGAMLGPVLPSSAFAVIAVLGLAAFHVLGRSDSGKR